MNPLRPALFLCLVAANVSAAVDVGAGSTLALGDAVVDFGCADLSIAGRVDVGAATTTGIDSVLTLAGGRLDGGSGRLGLSGDFANAGTFNAGTGTVAIGDGCGNTSSAIVGGQRFAALAVTTTTGKALTFTAGATTIVSPGPLVLQGAAGNLLRIRSTVAGAQSAINLSGGQSIRFVDVADNYASGMTLAPGPASSHDSIDSGNLFNWFEHLVAIPALSPLIAVFLAMLLLAAARPMLRARHATR